MTNKLPKTIEPPESGTASGSAVVKAAVAWLTRLATDAERRKRGCVSIKCKADAQYQKGKATAFRKAIKILREAKPPPGMNHFCRGESGAGEWSCRSTEVPSVCHYCGEPNEALRREVFAKVQKLANDGKFERSLD